VGASPGSKYIEYNIQSKQSLIGSNSTYKRSKSANNIDSKTRIAYHYRQTSKLTTNLQPIEAGLTKSVYFGDTVMLHWLWKETVGYLEKLERAVAEGRAVDEASNYARWLEFSGLLKIFDAYPRPLPLKVDGEAVRRLVGRVIDAAGEIYKGGHDAS